MTERALYFGRPLGIGCQRCGLYQTYRGHHSCPNTMCPVGLIELRRRNRARSSLIRMRSS